MRANWCFHHHHGIAVSRLLFPTVLPRAVCLSLKGSSYSSQDDVGVCFHSEVFLPFLFFLDLFQDFSFSGFYQHSTQLSARDSSLSAQGSTNHKSVQFCQFRSASNTWPTQHTHVWYNWIVRSLFVVQYLKAEVFRSLSKFRGAIHWCPLPGLSLLFEFCVRVFGAFCSSFRVRSSFRDLFRVGSARDFRVPQDSSHLSPQPRIQFRTELVVFSTHTFYSFAGAIVFPLLCRLGFQSSIIRCLSLPLLCSLWISVVSGCLFGDLFVVTIRGVSLVKVFSGCVEDFVEDVCSRGVSLGDSGSLKFSNQCVWSLKESLPLSFSIPIECISSLNLLALRFSYSHPPKVVTNSTICFAVLSVCCFTRGMH